jgi:YD repeat-containing protein
MKFWKYYIVLAVLTVGKSHAQQTMQVEKQRVTSIRYYTDAINMVCSDSILFAYSGTRGSQFKPYDFYAGAVYGFRDQYRYNGSILPAVDIPDPIADLQTMYVQHDKADRYTTGGTIGLLTRTTHTYGPKIRVSNHEQNPFSATQQITVYNADSLPAIIYEVDNRIGDTLYERVIHYNTQRQAIADTLRSLRPRFNVYFNYRYDAAGRLTDFERIPFNGISSVRHERTTYSYDANGRLVQVVQYDIDAAGNWQPHSKQAMEYDAKGNLLSHSEASGENIPRYHRQFMYNASGNIDSMFINYIDEDVVTDCYRVIFYFNGFHNPDSAVITNSCRAMVHAKQLVVYGYEQYYKDTLVHKGPLVIYPNPTTGILNIRWNGKLPLKGAVVNVFNSVGQLVQQQNIPQPQQVDVINMAGLASGVYYLRIVNTDGARVFAGDVVRY